jgi:hypothetical protein
MFHAIQHEKIVCALQIEISFQVSALYVLPNVAVQWLVLKFRVREVPDSSLGPEICSSELCGSPQSLQKCFESKAAAAWNCPRLRQTTSTKIVLHYFAVLRQDNLILMHT